MSSNSPRYAEPINNLAIGKVIEVDGTRVIAELDPALSELSRVYAGELYPIGQFGSIVKIHFGRRLIYGLVSRLRMRAEFDAERGLASGSSPDERIIEADLFGEGEWFRDDTGQENLRFERGVVTYPLPQQTVFLTPRSELRQIYGQSVRAGILLGEHVGSGGAPCFGELNELLGKHTAVLGSTGTGKSCAVCALIHGLLEKGDEEACWHPRIIILDPHNEYSAAFPVKSRLATDDGSLLLPYWLLSFQETVTLLIGKTEYAATSQTNIVKNALMKSRIDGATCLGLETSKITVDSPVPYSLASLRGHIDADKPSQLSKQDSHNSILQKLDTLADDARMAFLMTEWNSEAGDPFARLVLQLVGGGPQPRVVDLSGVPNEVAGIASAVIARTLFNVKVWQTEDERKEDPVVLVCEEAHRYVPNSGEAQYEAAQEAIRRIAKAGSMALGSFLCHRGQAR